VSLEDIDIAALAREVEALIPFNRVLGVHFDQLDANGASLTFEMRDDLVGNFARGALHGGVISATLDVVGGMTAMVAAGKRAEGEAIGELFGKLGTIDLRVDYLRPGVGKRFEATGSVLRAGTRVAVTRMQLTNDEGVVIAVGTGTYIVG
jgi:uncharacterized protein (TIGR00369 family)